MPKTYRNVEIDWEEIAQKVDGDAEVSGGYTIPEDVYLALMNMKSPIVGTIRIDLSDILKGGDDD